MRWRLLVFVVLLLPACTTAKKKPLDVNRAIKLVKAEAATSFRCTPADVTVLETARNDDGTNFGVAGCGKRARAVVVGNCNGDELCEPTLMGVEDDLPVAE